MIRRLPGGDLHDSTSGRSSRALPRRLAALAVAGVSALTLSACQLTSPLQTMAMYEAADGANVEFGDLEFDNLLVVSDAKGSPGTVVGMVTNNSQGPIQMTISASPDGQGAQPQSVVVPAQGTLQLSQAQGRSMSLPQVPAAPGAMVDLYIGSGGGRTALQVPVLPPTQYLKTLAPTSSGAPTASSTQSPSGQGSPTQSPGSPSGSATTQPPNTQAPTGQPTPTSTAG